MTTPQADDRSSTRRVRDEAIAAEPHLPAPALPADAQPAPVESHLRRGRKPMAVVGVVENGVVRLLDPNVHLPEQSRVIVVATEPR